MGQPPYLGIAEGFPQVLTYLVSVEQAERDLVNALKRHLGRRVGYEATRLRYDDSLGGRLAQQYRESYSDVP